MIDFGENEGQFGSSLLDKSTAKPASIDMSIFEKKSNAGQGSVSSDYLQKTREDNPEPDESANKKTTVSLAGCKFTTASDDLEIEDEFQAEVKAQWTGTVSPEGLRVTFTVKMTWDKDGTPQEEEGMEKLTGFMLADQSDQVVTVKGELPRPPSFPPAGTKVRYKLVASHPEAKDTSESDVSELVLLETLHYVEVPDILFAHGGHFPCLDDKNALIDALTRSLKWSKENPDEQLVVFAHADTSGDHPVNYDITDRRAQAALALLAHADKIWEELAKKHHKIEEIQRCLKTLTTCHGWSCDPGEVDDQDGPKTQGAVKKFQETCNQKYKLGLTVDGVAGPKTWKAMHRVICGLVAKGLDVTDPATAAYPDWPLPEIAYSEGNGAYGCGESFPVDRAEVDGLKSEENRRVDFLFCIGWNFLEPVPDRTRALTKDECLPYDREKMKWVPIAAGDVGQQTRYFSL